MNGPTAAVNGNSTPRVVTMNFVVLGEPSIPLPLLPILLSNMGMPVGGVHFGAPQGQSFEDLMDRLFRQQQPRGPPPASKSAIERLQEVEITAEQETQKCECSVCKDEFAKGDHATKLPCSHHFHKDCIVTWLKEHNTCPLCRYELPVDDADYEKERQERMKKRNIPEEHHEAKEAKREKQNPTEEPENTHEHHSCEMGKRLHQQCHLLESQKVVSLSCGHQFHEECLQSTLRVRGELESSQTLSSLEKREFHCPSCKKTSSLLPEFDLD